MHRLRQAIAWCALTAFSPLAAAGGAVSESLAVTTDALQGSVLEARGATIGHIRIDNRDIFDTDVDEESGVFYRLANALHIHTREDVIRQQLLLYEGSPFVARDVEESERLLRANRYLGTAQIRPVRYDGDAVDIDVVTEDVWSLAPSLRFARKGGANTGGVEISESNVLGSGSEVRLGYRSDVERDEAFFVFRDPQLGASRTALTLEYADTTDGQSHGLIVEQPFYSLDARRAGGIRLAGFDQVDSLYTMGEVDQRFEHSSQRFEAFFGWSDGLRDGHASRWTVGVGFDEHMTSPLEDAPGTDFPDRRDVFPFVGYEWIEDRYEKTRNADNLQIVEDRHLGTRLAGRLGYASDVWGADDSAWLASLGVQRGFKVFGGDTILASLAASGRFSDALPTQSLIDANLRYYRPQSKSRLLYLEIGVLAGRHLDSDRQLTLGGENGLRGYPIRYLNGDVVALATIEQRFYTDWYPFHLFHVGAAVFFDAGKVLRATDNMPGFEGWHRDIGAGLRISSPRSSSGRMLHLDYACPLDPGSGQQDCQVIIETRHTF